MRLATLFPHSSAALVALAILLLPPEVCAGFPHIKGLDLGKITKTVKDASKEVLDQGRHSDLAAALKGVDPSKVLQGSEQMIHKLMDNHSEQAVHDAAEASSDKVVDVVGGASGAKNVLHEAAKALGNQSRIAGAIQESKLDGASLASVSEIATAAADAVKRSANSAQLSQWNIGKIGNLLRKAAPKVANVLRHTDSKKLEEAIEETDPEQLKQVLDTLDEWRWWRAHWWLPLLALTTCATMICCACSSRRLIRLAGKRAPTLRVDTEINMWVSSGDGMQAAAEEPLFQQF